MADEIIRPSETPAGNQKIESSLNFLDIVGKTGLVASAVEVVTGAPLGAIIGAASVQNPVIGLGLWAFGNGWDKATLQAMRLAAAGDGAAVASAPGIIGAFASAQVLSLEAQLKFAQEHPEIFTSAMQSVVGGPMP
jgi:hypothetical protein